MRLSTMWAVDQVIDGEGRSPIVDRILTRWPHDGGSGRFFRSSANFLATFDHDGGGRFLRFADSSERNRAEIAAELDLLRWLDAAGLDVATPELSLGGGHLETVEAGGRVFHAVVFDELRGEQAEIEDLDEPGFRVWGESLGRLHVALRGFPNTNADRGSWHEGVAAAGRNIPPDAGEGQTELDHLQAALDELPTGPERYGLIHGDFELDNLVWRDGSIAMLDFDDCHESWHAADIAYALRDLFDARRGPDDPAVRAFLDGYAAFRDVDDLLLAAIPTFSRLARLVEYARIMRSLDLDEGLEYPDWLNGLIVRLRGRAEAYRASLSAR